MHKVNSIKPLISYTIQACLSVRKNYKNLFLTERYLQGVLSRQTLWWPCYGSTFCRCQNHTLSRGTGTKAFQPEFLKHPAFPKNFAGWRRCRSMSDRPGLCARSIFRDYRGRCLWPLTFLHKWFNNRRPSLNFNCFLWN